MVGILCGWPPAVIILVRMGQGEIHAYALGCSQLGDFMQLQLHGYGFVVQETLVCLSTPCHLQRHY